jgi:integrase
MVVGTFSGLSADLQRIASHRLATTFPGDLYQGQAAQRRDRELARRRNTNALTKNDEQRVLRSPAKADALRAKTAELGAQRIRVSAALGASGAIRHFDAHWYAALETLGIGGGFHFHDLRHTCASYLAKQGCSLLEIANVLGHKTLAMVKRYGHLVDDDKAKVIER